jgi:hypothetical protein
LEPTESGGEEAFVGWPLGALDSTVNWRLGFGQSKGEGSSELPMFVGLGKFGVFGSPTEPTHSLEKASADSKFVDVGAGSSLTTK